MKVALWRDKVGLCGQEVLAAKIGLHWSLAALLVLVLVFAVFGGGGDGGALAF